MKKILLTFLLLSSILFISAKIDWNKPDRGYFTAQKDIDINLALSTQRMATISYENQLFNFVNYYDGSTSKIILRRLSNIPNKENPEIFWSNEQEKTDDNFAKLGKLNWQPAPVVFNDILYLFVVDHDQQIAYSQYNAGDNTWSNLIKLPLYNGTFMAAVVINGKLCLIAQKYFSGDAYIHVTEDLVNWKEYSTNVVVGLDPGHLGYETYGISAIQKTYVENGTVKSKLLLGYITDENDARCAEYKFNDAGDLVLINDLLIDGGIDYTSIALAEGSVSRDPSTGICTQAFLKNKTADHSNSRYRILRFQKIEGSTWYNQENNLVKMNYLWADEKVNLTAANFAVNSGDNINQYMCLIYRGYDAFDHPLNCAWAKTDYFKFAGSHDRKTLSEPENTQYIGYIEGVPPYYLNKNEELVNEHNLSISEVANKFTVAHEAETTIGFDVGLKTKFQFAGFKEEVSFAYGHRWGDISSVTVTHTMSFEPLQDDPTAYYLTQQPVINRANYNVYDVNDRLLYTTFYFYLSAPKAMSVAVDLPSHLVPNDPETYMDRGINWLAYDNFTDENTTISWVKGEGIEGKVEVEDTKSQTNSYKEKIALGFDVHEIFDIDVEGSFEFEMVTTTKIGHEISCATRLNAPRPGTKDVNALAYDFHWIKRTDGQNNWWLHPDQDPTQNTWCVTYDVFYIARENGESKGTQSLTETLDSTLTDIAETEIPKDTWLIQNYPNPFRNTTTIRYRVEHNTPTQLAIYNVMGKKVAMLVNDVQTPGIYEIEWDAMEFPVGVYFCSFYNGGNKENLKLMLTK